MCNLSEGIAKTAYERGYKKGLLIGQILTLSSCMKKGYITLEETTEYSGMSVEEFLQKAEEYEKKKNPFKALMITITG